MSLTTEQGVVAVRLMREMALWPDSPDTIALSGPHVRWGRCWRFKAWAKDLRENFASFGAFADRCEDEGLPRPTMGFRKAVLRRSYCVFGSVFWPPAPCETRGEILVKLPCGRNKWRWELTARGWQLADCLWSELGGRWSLHNGTAATEFRWSSFPSREWFKDGRESAAVKKAKALGFHLTEKIIPPRTAGGYTVLSLRAPYDPETLAGRLARPKEPQRILFD